LQQVGFSNLYFYFNYISPDPNTYTNT